MARIRSTAHSSQDRVVLAVALSPTSSRNVSSRPRPPLAPGRPHDPCLDLLLPQPGQLLAHRLPDEALCRRGILRMDEGKVLLLFKRKIYPELDPAPDAPWRQP